MEPLQQDQINAFRSDGFLVLPALLHPPEIDEIRQTFMDAACNGPVPGLSEAANRNHALLSDDPLARFPRMMHPHRHPDLPVGPVAMKYMLDHRLHAVLRTLMADEPLAAQSMFYFKPPGARGQALHQDNFYLRVKPGTCMAAWLAIDDADAENGGMLCVPGTANLEITCPEQADRLASFTTEHVPPPAGMKEQLVPLKAGDVLLFNGSVIHGSYPNTTRDRFRRALIFHYVPTRSTELSTWYQTLRFDGTLTPLPPATGGGPCGSTDPHAGAIH